MAEVVRRSRVWTGVVSGVLVLACLWAAYSLVTVPLAWRLSPDTFGSTVGALVLVSAFVERVVEVFLSVWKRPEVDGWEQELEYWQAVQVDRRADIGWLEQKLTEATLPAPDRGRFTTALEKKRDEAEAAERKADDLEKALVPFRAETRRLAMWIGTAVGVLASLVGVRLLAGLVDVSLLTGRQKQWFVVVDVLFTGVILAGGSKGVHRVSTLLGTITEAAEARAAQRKLAHGTPPNPPAGG